MFASNGELAFEVGGSLLLCQGNTLYFFVFYVVLKSLLYGVQFLIQREKLIRFCVFQHDCNTLEVKVHRQQRFEL